MKAFMLIACMLIAATCFSQVYPAVAKYGKQNFFVKGDTIELAGNIRYIKVDGKVYEIKRSTSIQEAAPSFPGGVWPTLKSGPIDTAIIKPWHISTYASEPPRHYVIED